MMTRLIAGVFAAVVVVGLLSFGSLPVIMSVVVLCSGIAYLEFDRLFFPERDFSRQLRVIAAVALVTLAIPKSWAVAWVIQWLSFALICFSNVVTGERHGDFQATVRQLSLELLASIYIVSLLGFIVPILAVENGRYYLLLLFLIVFLGDTAAYFAGSRWGKRRLAPHLSPKKSVEGSAAALIASLVTSVVWLLLTPAHLRGQAYAIKILAATPFISILAQAGDLFESLLKRCQQCKDSGSFLPGHGGLLDRVDGLALSSPIFYFFIVYVLEQF